MVKVLDFGLVRAYHDGKGNRAQELMEVAEGTPLFMPPEAFADSAAADPRSDIYFLGAVGYYLLCGAHLFDADSEMELYQKHAEEKPIPPHARTEQSISRNWKSWCYAAWRKNPTCVYSPRLSCGSCF